MRFPSTLLSRLPNLLTKDTSHLSTSIFAPHPFAGSEVPILQKLWRYLVQEKRDMVMLVVYSMVTGLLALVVPLSSQAIINIVQLGVISVQFYVVCVVITLGLMALGGFYVFEAYIVDILQRRLFVQTAFEITRLLSSSHQNEAQASLTPELINRFFDVPTVQKTLGKLLLDGVSALLTGVVIGLLLAFYHPFFLLFDVVLILFIVVVVFILSKGGLKTNLKESKKKYALVHTFEEIARCRASYTNYADRKFIYAQVDTIVKEYVYARSKHFMVLARQMSGAYFFKALATVGVLGLGGQLVLEQQLTIGQLVAAELLVLTLLGSLEKIFAQIEGFYDLLTGIDKISHIVGLPQTAGLKPSLVMPEKPSSAGIHVQNLSMMLTKSQGRSKALTVTFPAGSKNCLIGGSGAGKSSFCKTLAGFIPPETGVIHLNGFDTRLLQPEDFYSIVSYVGSTTEIFEGTLYDNLCMGRDFGVEHCIKTLQFIGLYDEIESYPEGLNYTLFGSGENVMASFRLRLLLTRAILGNPALLILDTSFDVLSERLTKLLVQRLYKEHPCTIIHNTMIKEWVRFADNIALFDKGDIVETGSPEILTRSETQFFNFAPDLAREIIRDRQ